MFVSFSVGIQPPSEASAARSQPRKVYDCFGDPPPIFIGVPKKLKAFWGGSRLGCTSRSHAMSCFFLLSIYNEEFEVDV